MPKESFLKLTGMLFLLAFWLWFIHPFIHVHEPWEEHTNCSIKISGEVMALPESLPVSELLGFSDGRYLPVSPSQHHISINLRLLPSPRSPPV